MNYSIERYPKPLSVDFMNNRFYVYYKRMDISDEAEPQYIKSQGVKYNLNFYSEEHDVRKWGFKTGPVAVYESDEVETQQEEVK